MNEENKGQSLREALAAGFDRVAAEENSAGTPAEMAQQETPAAQPNAEAPAAQAMAQQSQTAPNEGVQAQAPNAQPDAAQPDRMAMAMQLIEALRSENARLMAQNQQQAQAMQQQSQAAEAAMENSVTTPQIPQLNFRELQYMSDEEQQDAISQWQKAVAESTLAQVRGEIDPIRKDYEDKRRIAENDAARSSIFRDSRFPDFEANSADIERIAATADFQNMSPERRYLYSGLIARGLKHDPSAQPTTDEIVQMALSNPDVLRAIETRRAQEVQKKNDSLPVLSASSGLGGANPVPENSVKTKEELEARMKQRFGL